MAEVIGAVAAIGSLVTTGVKLSTALFEFAGNLGSAGAEIRTIASDVVLYCQVLDQVQSTLSQGSEVFRIPEAAAQTAEQIVERCRNVFDAISQIVLNLDSGDQHSPIERMARVKWTLRDRKRVALLQESLKGCTAHLQLMVQCMTFARTFPMPSVSPEDRLALERRQEYHRSLTYSLILAQQAVNDRIEELEDECSLSTPEASSLSGSTLVPPSGALLGMLSPPESPGRPRHRRNRSSQILNGIVYSPPQVDSMLEDRRLSALLNKSLYPDSVSRESLRDIGNGISNHRQSAVLCDTLMRSWIDQDDILVHEAKGNVADLDPTMCQSPRIPSVFVEKIRESMVLDDPDTANQAFGANTLEVIRSTSKIISMPPLSALPEPYRMYDIIEYGREYVPYVIWHDQDSWTRLDEVPLSELVQLDSEGQKPLFMLRRLRPASMLHSIEKTPGGLPEIFKSPELSSLPAEAIDGENGTATNIQTLQNTESSLSELLLPSNSVVPESLPSPPAQAVTPTNEALGDLLKDLRVKLDDPCWKVLPVALGKSNIEDDWQSYALYIMYGSCERYVGLEEKPLALFKDLDREGKMPCFTLRKIQVDGSKPDEGVEMPQRNLTGSQTPSSDSNAAIFDYTIRSIAPEAHLSLPPSTQYGGSDLIDFTDEPDLVSNNEVVSHSDDLKILIDGEGPPDSAVPLVKDVERNGALVDQ